MKRSAILIFILFLSAGVFAQFEGEITGVVRDSVTKQTLPGAGMLLSSNGVGVMDAMADANGQFTFKPLKPGNYDISVSYLGYGVKVFSNVQVDSRGFTYFECLLTSGGNGLMDTVYVRPPLVDKTQPGKIDTFTDEDINHMAVTSPGEVAVQADGVLGNEQTGGLYINGSREDATLYVIDGVKVIGSLYLPMKAIKEINVITGGIPASYGDVTGGIVEIITKGYAGIY